MVGPVRLLALVAQAVAPDPVGRLVFANQLLDWQLTREAERERQAVAGFVEDLGLEGAFR